MAAIVASKTGFYILYILLFTAGVLQAAKFTNIEGKFLTKLDDVEDRIVTYRIVKCFSEEGRFGVIDKSRVDENNLGECFTDGKYGFKIDLFGFFEEDTHLEFGDVNAVRHIERYVIVDGNAARLEVDYSKNAA